MTRPTPRINATDERRKEFSAIEALLLELHVKVEHLQADVLSLRRVLTQPVDPDDAQHAGLMQEIHRSTKGRPFIAADLLLDAEIDTLLWSAIHRAVPDLAARKLGKFLEGIEGRVFAGLFIRRLGKDRQGCRWQCFEM